LGVGKRLERVAFFLAVKIEATDTELQLNGNQSALTEKPRPPVEFGVGWTTSIFPWENFVGICQEQEYKQENLNATKLHRSTR